MKMKKYRVSRWLKKKFKNLVGDIGYRYYTNSDSRYKIRQIYKIEKRIAILERKYYEQ